MELHLLSDGYFTLDKSFLVYTKYSGQTYEAALKPLLILTGKEKILVETGIGELPEAHKQFHTIKRKQDQTLKAQLQKHNLKPEDITTVVNTHLHFDHCGNNALFPKAKFYVQAEELRYAYAPDRFQKAAYIREFFDANLDYLPVRGKYQLTENIILVPTPGHSIGHQSVLIKGEKKPTFTAATLRPSEKILKKETFPEFSTAPMKR